MRAASALSFSFYFNGKEKSKTKFALFGVAVVFSSALAGPALAQHRAAQPDSYAQTGACPGREAGNPYAKEDDYMAWSMWRARGGWDDRNDWYCLHNNHLHRHGAAF
jgi:hypothetical protein